MNSDHKIYSSDVQKIYKSISDSIVLDPNSMFIDSPSDSVYDTFNDIISENTTLGDNIISSIINNRSDAVNSDNSFVEKKDNNFFLNENYFNDILDNNINSFEEVTPSKIITNSIDIFDKINDNNFEDKDDLETDMMFQVLANPDKLVNDDQIKYFECDEEDSENCDHETDMMFQILANPDKLVNENKIKYFECDDKNENNDDIIDNKYEDIIIELGEDKFNNELCFTNCSYFDCFNSNQNTNMSGSYVIHNNDDHEMWDNNYQKRNIKTVLGNLGIFAMSAVVVIGSSLLTNLF